MNDVAKQSAAPRPPLPKRFCLSPKEAAYRRLRRGNAASSSKSHASVPLQRLDDHTDRKAPAGAFEDFISQDGAPGKALPPAGSLARREE